MGRMRNNISRLPAESRARISQMLDDGATYDEIRADPDVAAACASRGVQLHASTFQAWAAGGEHRGYVEGRRRYGAEIERRRLAAWVVSQDDAADDLARIANFEVLRRVLERLESGGELDAKELSAAAQALQGYERNRLAERRDGAMREADRREEAYRARIAELEAKVAELSAGRAGNGLSKEALEEIERKIGLM